MCLGRNGSFDLETGTLSLEMMRFYHNRPAVERVRINPVDGALKLHSIEKIAADFDLSRGGNGVVTFCIATDGAYRCSSLLYTSGRIESRLLVVKDGEVGVFSLLNEGVLEAAKMLGFDFQKRLSEQKSERKRRHDEALAILREIEAEHCGFDVESHGGIEAAPVFREPPSAQDVIAAMHTPEFDRDVYIVANAAPVHYVVRAPVFAKASTGEAAIKDALRIQSEREAAKERAKKNAEALGLRELKGTPKQVAWALQIRDAFASANPNSPNLRRATTAKWWIENRTRLLTGCGITRVRNRNNTRPIGPGVPAATAGDRGYRS